jgi:hypothetical protein
MKATHWTHSDDPEQWMDDPCKSPEDAAELFFVEDYDGALDHRNMLVNDGKTEITVYGYIETDALLHEDRQFDGYKPGQSYFAPTGEELTVEVRRTFKVKESNAQHHQPGDHKESK